VPNFQGARCPVVSTFNIDNWTSYLEHYEDKIVIEFLRYGWPINFDRTFLPISTLCNHPSAQANAHYLSNYVISELSFDSICGPFSCNPFDVDCVISPLLCVTKRDSDKLRVVHDLSFPDNLSVNSGISKDSYLDIPYTLRLPGIDRLVTFINHYGQGCHVFKKDLSRAYRQLPVDPRDYHLLGFQVDGQFYFHTRFPFGLRSAALACQRTNRAVVYILNQMDILVDVYIDDFYGAASSDQSASSFQKMNSVFSDLGLAASAEKDVSPCTNMICLGIEVDTDRMTLTVPDFRVQELRSELSSWLSCDNYSKRELQQLLGKLSFVSACVRPGRIFMCRLLNALRQFPDSRSARVDITDSMKDDIRWWVALLQHYNGVSVVPRESIIADAHLFATDACLRGCGAICFNEYFKCSFPDDFFGFHINELEFLTILVAVKLWAPRLQGLSLELASDNTMCVSVINNHRSSNLFVQRCLRELWTVLSLFNITLTARYVASKQNVLADWLSRYYTDDDCRIRFDDYVASHPQLREILSVHYTIKPVIFSPSLTKILPKGICALSYKLI